jgi:hypothetical protein
MRFVDKVVEANGVTPMNTPSMKQMKKWESALLQT